MFLTQSFSICLVTDDAEIELKACVLCALRSVTAFGLPPASGCCQCGLTGEVKVAAAKRRGCAISRTDQCLMEAVRVQKDTTVRKSWLSKS